MCLVPLGRYFGIYNNRFQGTAHVALGGRNLVLKARCLIRSVEGQGARHTLLKMVFVANVLLGKIS